MLDYAVEHRSLRGGLLSADLARHLQSRCLVGSAVIVSDRPPAYLSSVRKQWKGLARYLERQRASSLSELKRSALAVALQRMYSLRFSLSSGTGDVDVLFLSPDGIRLIPDGCATVYLCSSQVEAAALQGVLARLLNYAVVVDYAGVLAGD